MRLVRAVVLLVGLTWPLSSLCSRASAQKFDLDDFIKPGTPSGAPPAATSAKPAPSKPATSAPVEKPTGATPSKEAVSGPASAAAAKPTSAAVAKPAAAAPLKPVPSPTPAGRVARSAPTQAAPEPEPAAAETPAERRSKRPMSAPERVARTPKVRPEKPKRVKKKTPYDLISDKWHEPAPLELSAEHAKAAVPALVFRIQKTGAVYVLQPASRQGGFDESQLAIAKEAFNSWGPTPHPRVLDLVYAATIQFNAPYVTLISGIRKDRGGSRHSHGLAADVVLPGVEDETLAAFFRAQGFCGVGTYPRSHFVHVDTRDQSYFWIDSSKPNQRGRVVQVRKDESTAADQAAVARGSDGFVNPPRLQKALNVRLVRRRKQHQAKLERAAAKATEPMPNSGPVPSSVTPEK